ncbi:MFS sugar transporter [Niveomyces insectorum RCEF 264]|uniref:MFS sugar transporter n=1 Tax=Niveomyces insectorum RCEF 264 TaxID=1081102 RepID=A0A167PJL0_9HYPO|nr:MFS sugar transporter [Niveomyces insectorum RCEF 264]
MATSRFKQPYFGLRGGWLTFWITVACSTDMSLFGYDQGVFSGVVISDDYLAVHNLAGKTNLSSIITSIYAIGCTLGAIVAFTVGERMGRRKTILVGTTIMAIGAILQASSFSVPHMMVGRIVSGIGNGVNTATAPVWQTETSSMKWRGKLVVLEMAMNIFGYMTVNWINYGLSFAGGAIAWRLPLALQMVFILVLYATVPWLPESPRWLIAHGRLEDAVQILADIDDRAVDDPYIVAERKEIVYSVQYEIENAVRWRDLLRGRTHKGTKTIRRLVLGAASQGLQQFGGINVMSYYMPTLLITSVGLTNSMARLITACAAIAYLFASIAAAPLVERFGRRIMMVVSTTIQFFCFLLMTVLLYFNEKAGYAHASAVAKASVPFFFIYLMGFGLGMLGIPWLYPTEINSLPMRTKGAAVATAMDWLTNFIVVEITPVGITNLGWRFYIIFTVLNAAFLPILYLFFPETSDRTLEDLDAFYREDPPLIVVGHHDSTCRRRPARFAAMQDRDIHEAEGTLRDGDIHEVGGTMRRNSAKLSDEKENLSA